MNTDALEARGPEVPVLQETVRATVKTIDARARIYRYAARSAALTFVIPILSALWSFSWRPLLLAVLLVPLVGAYLVVDDRIVRDWQRCILSAWISRNLELSDLRYTLQAMRHLPTSTVVGMLNRLPAYDTPQQLEPRSASDRASIAKGCVTHSRRLTQRTLLAVAGATILVGSLGAALLTASASPLLGSLLGVLLIEASRDRWRTVKADRTS